MGIAGLCGRRWLGGCVVHFCGLLGLVGCWFSWFLRVLGWLCCSGGLIADVMCLVGLAVAVVLAASFGGCLVFAGFSDEFGGFGVV